MAAPIPRSCLFKAGRQLAFRPRPVQDTVPRISFQAGPRRRYASDDKSTSLPTAQGEDAQGPNMQQQEHVSEEAAKMAQITGGEGPDMSVGTPVQDILKEEKELQKTAPQVLKDSIKQNAPTPKPQTRSFSTYARRRQDMQLNETSAQLPPQEFLQSNSTLSPLSDLSESMMPALTPVDVGGHKFGLPTLPIPANMHKDYRYDPVVEQVTNLMMKHGEKAKAQRNMALILQHLRTAPPPVYNPQRPLIPGAPPASHLPLNPTMYLTLVLDSLAPLLRIRQERGAAGGGLSLQIPVALHLRQRRRQAFTWILDSASKKINRGTGKGDFARRIAEEIVSVAEGKSALWDRRTSLHKAGTTARVNIGFDRSSTKQRKR